jgi:hypothetical protein
MTQQRDRLDIKVMKREVQRLPALEAGWASLEPEDRVAFRAEWHDLMDIFGHLVTAAEAGRLAESNSRDLSAVADALTSALPALERMRLRRPDPEVLARMRLAAAT